VPASAERTAKIQSLQDAGLEHEAVAAWQASAPSDIGDFSGDCLRYSRYWQTATALLARLPAKPDRTAQQPMLPSTSSVSGRNACAFPSAHASALYDRLTRNRTRFVRVEQLVYDAAAMLPGLTPTRAR
jgi:thioesterase DpgC